MRPTLLLPLVALVACTEDAPPVDDAGVLRDCAATPGTICPYAGVGADGFNGDGNDKLDTWFSFPMSITFSPYGAPVIADWNNHRIRLVEDDGTVSTIMGSGFPGDGDPAGLDLTVGAPGGEVNLNHPTQQFWQPDGTLVSASWHAHKIRTWDPATGLAKVWLGRGAGWNETGEDVPGAAHPAGACLLNQPVWVLPDESGDVWILDMRNERIRRLDVGAFTIQTEAGSGAKGVFGAEGCDSTDALATCFNFPKNANPEPGGSLAFDADFGRLFVADTESHVIRVLDRATGAVTVFAGAPGEAGDVDATGADARFAYPVGLAFDAATDTLFVADANNHKIRAIDATTGAVTTFAGTGEPTCPTPLGLGHPEVCPGQSRSGDGGPALEAALYRPFGVSLDLDGNVVIADTNNHRFRVVYR